MAAMESSLRERLASVPWATLQHAYGTAQDTPEHLLALLSDDADMWQEAMSNLWASICHQGTVYAASCAAVPFLLEIVAMFPDARKPELLQLLGGLANRDCYANRDRNIMHVDRHLSDFIKPDRYVSWSYGQFIQEGGEYQDPHTMAVAHERVGEGIPIILTLLGDSSDKTQQVALYLLSAFKEHSTRIVPAMEALLTHSHSPFVRASALLGLSSVLESGSLVWDRLITYIEPDHPALLRFVSALALARYHANAANPTAVRLLIEAMVNPRQLDELYAMLPWADGSVHVGAAAALGQLGIPTGLDGLCTALQEGAPGWRVLDTVRVAEVLLDVAFFGDWVQGRYWSSSTNIAEHIRNGSANLFEDRSYYGYGMSGTGGSDGVITCLDANNDEAVRLKERFEREGQAALTTAQRQALLAVVACVPLWQTKHELMAVYGLSGTRDALSQLVE